MFSILDTIPPMVSQTLWSKKHESTFSELKLVGVRRNQTLSTELIINHANYQDTYVLIPSKHIEDIIQFNIGTCEQHQKVKLFYLHASMIINLNLVSHWLILDLEKWKCFHNRSLPN